MYQKVPTDMKFVKREEATLAFWRERDIINKSYAFRDGRPIYTFYDGPPTANGRPHIGHVLTRCIKDLIPRYKTMQGFSVLRKAGWDTQGLPVELEVEKALGLDGKPQIEAYGVEKFIKACKDSVFIYKSDWEKMSERVGFWVDMDHPYITYENEYIESVWWSLKTLWDKGLIYKGHKVVPYCPRCGTALSSHEVAQGYQDITDITAVVRFKVKDRENEYVLAWTTTPWTLPSNVALCVGPDIDYVRAEHEGNIYILAKALVNGLLGEDAKILETMKGSSLEHLRYEPLFPYGLEKSGDGYFIVCDDYVTTGEGTGVVHIAPAFGEDDNRVGRKYNLKFLQMVDTQGRFIEGTGDITGVFAKDADPMIIGDLKSRGLLFTTYKHEHSYPFCWRCDTPLLYYARESWFIEMTRVKEQLIANNRSVNWLPNTIRDGRMGNFLDNVVDWSVSRERYWGTPLPIWECECGHRDAVGSIAELHEKCNDVPEGIELHKPYIDQVTMTCGVCGKTMHRTPEVIDCWYDAGSMPFAQWHYPFENKEKFEQNFPAQFISEAVDQTRGWFYTLLAISTAVFDRSPFENCVVLGHVNDKDGIKMSKHKGNVVEPFQTLNILGADAVRWYFYTSSAPWLPSRYYEEAVAESQRKFMGTLWNTYAFYVLYADIDGFDPTKVDTAKLKLTIMDQWILSKLNSLVNTVTEQMDEYHITESARAIANFVDELSNWYVRRGRERYWGPEMDDDKIAAFRTLHHVLVTVAKTAAPFIPFMSEQIYQNLVRNFDASAPESVHLCDFPVADLRSIDTELEENMQIVVEITTLARAARNGAGIKIRQPLSMMYIQGGEPLPEEYLNIISDELNVHALQWVADASMFTDYSLKPQMRTLGPRYGKLLGKIGAALQQTDGSKAMKGWQEGHDLELMVDGQAISLTRDDVLAESTQRPGFHAVTERELTVVLDCNLTEELIEEGFVRECISKLQTQRKEAGFEVIDRIEIYIEAPEIKEILARNSEAICQAVLGVKMEFGDAPDGAYTKQWDLNGKAVTLSVVKVS